MYKATNFTFLIYYSTQILYIWVIIYNFNKRMDNTETINVVVEGEKIPVPAKFAEVS